MSRDEVILVRDKGLVTSIESFIAGYYVGEMVNEVSAICGIIPVSIIVVTNGVRLWDFRTGTVKVVV